MNCVWTVRYTGSSLVGACHAPASECDQKHDLGCAIVQEHAYFELDILWQENSSISSSLILYFKDCMFCLGQALKSQCILWQNFLFLTIEGGPTIKPLLLPRSPKYVILRLIRLRCYDERLCVRSVQPFLKGPPNWPSTVARLASPAISCWMAGWRTQNTGIALILRFFIGWIHGGQLESAFCSAFENSSERASCCHWRRRHLKIPIIQGHRVKNHLCSCPNHPRCHAIYSNSLHYFTCWSLRFRAEVPIAACRAALQLQLNEPVLSAKRKRGNQHFCREPPKRLGLLLLNCFFCCKKRRTKHFFCLRQRYGTATSIASLSKCSFWTTNECLLTSLCIMNMRWRLWHCWM